MYTIACAYEIRVSEGDGSHRFVMKNPKQRCSRELVSALYFHCYAEVGLCGDLLSDIRLKLTNS